MTPATSQEHYGVDPETLLAGSLSPAEDEDDREVSFSFWPCLHGPALTEVSVPCSHRVLRQWELLKRPKVKGRGRSPKSGKRGRHLLAR